MIQVECGETHCAAVDVNGDVYTWGGKTVSKNRGQLGHADTKPQENPKRVKGLELQRVVRVACGGYFTLCLTDKNELWGFGAGEQGESGYGEARDTSVPKKIDLPSKNDDLLKELC